MYTAIILIEVLLLVGVSALCSGLNIAFMALSLADLRRKAKLGNLYAKRLLPLRRNGHRTLAAILLINVAAVSATSLVLEREFNGLIAGVVTTLLIVVFGEILPQAFFVRDALKLCGRLAPVLRLMVFVTYPVAKPLQLMLDKVLGKETPQLQSRHELGILISEHLHRKESELDDDEVEIMRGALQLSEKRVRDIMTPIEQVYWLRPDSLLDAKHLEDIKTNGRSRIPIFNARLTTCYGVLLMKDLIDVDFDNATPPLRVDDLPLYPCQMVGNMTALDTMFRKFVNAHTHLIPIERDDVVVGIVTIEDLLEEILGHEIEDETDYSRQRAERTTGR